MHIIVKEAFDRGPAEVLPQWLAPTARAMDYCGTKTGVGWIRIKIGPNMALDSTVAEHDPKTSEIEINSDRTLPGVSPEDIDLRDDLFVERYPMFTGALYHELGHALASYMTPYRLAKRGMSPQAIEIIVALEEPRVEYVAISEFDAAADGLASLALTLIASEFKGSRSAYSGSISLALVMGRVIAGTFTEKEGEEFRAAISGVLTDDQIDALIDLARVYITGICHPTPGDSYSDEEIESYVATLTDLTNRWIDIIEEPSDEEDAESTVLIPGVGDAESSDSHPDEDGDNASDENDGEEAGDAGEDGEEQADIDENADDSGDAAKLREKKPFTPVLDVHASDREHDGPEDKSIGDLAAEIAEAALRMRDARDVRRVARIGKIKAKRDAAARREMSKRHAAGKVAHAGAWSGSMAEHKREFGMRKTEPTNDMRRAAIALKKALVKATFRDEGKISVAQSAPAKRLRGGAVVQRAAAQSQGRRSDALIWKGKKRSPDAPDIPVRVGVLTDVSGSMNAYEIPSATINYIVGNAVTSMGGHYSNIAFGEEAYGIVRNGHKVRDLISVRADESTENIKNSLLALDREIDLIDGDGIKILILLSDGQFVDDSQRQWADKMFPALATKGVVLLHIDLDRYGGPSTEPSYRHNNPVPPMKMDPHTPPTKIAQNIADVLISEVERRYRAA